MIHLKTGPDRFSNLMSPGLAESVPGPLVMRHAVFLQQVVTVDNVFYILCIFVYFA